MAERGISVEPDDPLRYAGALVHQLPSLSPKTGVLVHQRPSWPFGSAHAVFVLEAEAIEAGATDGSE